MTSMIDTLDTADLLRTLRQNQYGRVSRARVSEEVHVLRRSRVTELIWCACRDLTFIATEIAHRCAGMICRWWLSILLPRVRVSGAKQPISVFSSHLHLRIECKDLQCTKPLLFLPFFFFLQVSRMLHIFLPFSGSKFFLRFFLLINACISFTFSCVETNAMNTTDIELRRISILVYRHKTLSL